MTDEPITIKSIEDKVRDLFVTSLKAADERSPRTQQSVEGRLGPSDIGFCRMKAVLVTRQEPRSDEKSMWAANMGTAAGIYIEEALSKALGDDVMTGTVDNVTVTATLPSGVQISGHPDVILPELNMVIDIKTVDGFDWVGSKGPSLSHLYQRHLYALGCIEAGILTEDRPLLVGNIYFDRSGKEPIPLVFIEVFDHSLDNEIDAWISDVIYAVKNNEDASRDIAPAVCAKICEFYTVCRGGTLPVNDGQDIITDAPTIEAIEFYDEGRALVKKGEGMMKAAKPALVDINGMTDRFQVRWVEIPATVVGPFEKRGYKRLDVTPIKD